MKDTTSNRFFAWGLIFWAGFMVAATIDGVLRGAVLADFLGPAGAHIAGGLFMLVVIYAGTWAFLRIVGVPRGSAPLLALGIVWGGITIAFELFIVMLASGEPASALWADYHPANMLRGNLILPGLILMVLAPVLMARVMR